MGEHHQTLDGAYEHATACLDWLGQLCHSFDPENDARLGRRASDGLSENEAKTLTLCYPLQQWLDAGALPDALMNVHPAPIQRLGITARCVHQLVKEIVGTAVLRVCEVVKPGSTRDFSPHWGDADLPELDYEQLLRADRFAVGDAIRLERIYSDDGGPLTTDDFTWLATALRMEHGKAMQSEIARAETSIKSAAKALPATTANDARDKWVYEQCCKLVKYSAISRQVGKKTKWEPLPTTQAVRNAANRYASSHNLPPIPSRQPGRPPK